MEHVYGQVFTRELLSLLLLLSTVRLGHLTFSNQDYVLGIQCIKRVNLGRLHFCSVFEVRHPFVNDPGPISTFLTN